MEEHVNLVRDVLSTLAQPSLFVKLSKCEFHKHPLTFLGCCVSAEGMGMDPDTITAVKDWDTPRTWKQLQRFLEFANFYRPFILNFTLVVLTLTNLLKTKGKGPQAKHPGAPLDWSPDCDVAFQKGSIDL